MTGPLSSRHWTSAIPGDPTGWVIHINTAFVVLLIEGMINLTNLQNIPKMYGLCLEGFTDAKT